MTQRRIWGAVAITLSLLGCSPADTISVANAWIRPPAPGFEVAAGYFDITNNGPPLELIGADSAAAGTIEIHSETHDGDMMQMRQLDRVALPPHAQVSFSPGGMHLMLLRFTGVTSPSVPVTLRFSDGSAQVVEFEMRTLSGDPTR